MPTVSVSEGTLWYEESGTGLPLVLLHGGWLNSDTWRPQVRKFADEYRVVTFDLRGHGRTGVTGVRRYSIDLFVDDLERLLSHLDIDKPILCGISIGGMILQSYLDRHPRKARKIVIGGPLQSMPPVTLPPSVKSFFSPLPIVAAMVSTIGPAATFEWLTTSIRATTGRRWLTVNSTVRTQVMAALAQIEPDEYRKIFRALYEFVPPDLSDVQTPTLVLYGDHESALIKCQGKRLAETIADGSCREIPNAGHLVNQDRPQLFNTVCEAFFSAETVEYTQ